MAKKMDYSMYLLAIVAIVAVVGIVIMVNGNCGISDTLSEDVVDVADGEANLAGEAWKREIPAMKKRNAINKENIKGYSNPLPRGFSCVDTDGPDFTFPSGEFEFDYGEFGKILGTNYEDECLSDSELLEYFCTDDGKVGSETVYCYDGNGDGTCFDVDNQARCGNGTTYETPFQ